MSGNSDDKIDLARLDRALAKLAAVIEESGDDVYWPIFERLEREREKMTERNARLRAAKLRVQADQANREERS
jgi:hypothetical protein